MDKNPQREHEDQEKLGHEAGQHAGIPSSSESYVLVCGRIFHPVVGALYLWSVGSLGTSTHRMVLSIDNFR